MVNEFEMDELFCVCPYATAQKILQGKWTILILHKLEEGPLRFNELQRRMPKVTHTTLTKQLRYLEEERLISRNVYPQVPPRVEYQLTDVGMKFKPVLSAIRAWAYEYIKDTGHTPVYDLEKYLAENRKSDKNIVE